MSHAKKRAWAAAAASADDGGAAAAAAGEEIEKEMKRLRLAYDSAGMLPTLLAMTSESETNGN